MYVFCLGYRFICFTDVLHYTALAENGFYASAGFSYIITCFQTKLSVEDRHV